MALKKFLLTAGAILAFSGAGLSLTAAADNVGGADLQTFEKEFFGSVQTHFADKKWKLPEQLAGDFQNDEKIADEEDDEKELEDGDAELMYGDDYDRKFHWKRKCIDLKNLRDINLYVSEDMYAVYSDIEGRAVVGDDARIAFYSVGENRFFGKQLSCPQIRRFFWEDDKKDRKGDDDYDWKDRKGDDDYDWKDRKGDDDYDWKDRKGDDDYDWKDRKGDYDKDRKHERRRLNEKEFSLIVEDQVVIFSSRIYNGGLAYGDKDSAILIEPTDVGKDCEIAKAKGLVDFKDINKDLRRKSFVLSSLRPTAQYSIFGTTLTLEFNPKAHVQVFEIDGRDLLRARTIATKGKLKRGTTVIINVKGAYSAFYSLNMESLAPFKHHLLWNFHKAQSVYVFGVAVHGSVLAPRARIFGASGVVWGQVMTKNWGAASSYNQIQVQNIPFRGTVCFHRSRKH